MSFWQSILAVFTPAPIAPESNTAAPGNPWHPVTASSFADPADVAAFRQKKAEGLSDHQAFKFGDNGVGYWGDDCSQGSGPRCALPPETWHPHPHPRLAKVEVRIGARSAICELADTMPHLENIRNGAGLDMNPDLCAALGVKPPVMVRAAWRWAV